MTIRSKNQHLYQRNGIWYFNRRLLRNSGHQRYSLKTTDLEEARCKRDKLLAEWAKFAQEVEGHNDVLALRRKYLGLFKEDEQELFEDLIIEKSEELADRAGAWHELKSLRPVEELSDKAKKPIDFWKTATGRLTPFVELTPSWLESLENKKTRLDYRRGMEVLSKYFVAAEEITWEKARAFLREAQSTEKVSGVTVKKWLSAYTNFWDFYDRDTAVWKNHKIKQTKTKKPRPWSSGEVIRIYNSLVQHGHWLQHPVWIAAHTGARLGAISKLTYDPTNQTITFQAQKREEHERVIPAHHAIIPNLENWVDNRKSKSSISGRFSEFKTELGFGPEVDFHSFRRTFCTEMENLGCPEGVTADIVGHKKQTMSYGVYSGGYKLDQMAEWLTKLSYRLENP